MLDDFIKYLAIITGDLDAVNELISAIDQDNADASKKEERRGCRCNGDEFDIDVDKVFFNGRSTTVVWTDGVKTTVTCRNDEQFDEYAGFAAAVMKRLFGSTKTAMKFLDTHKVVQESKKNKHNKH